MIAAIISCNLGGSVELGTPSFNPNPLAIVGLLVFCLSSHGSLYALEIIICAVTFLAFPVKVIDVVFPSLLFIALPFAATTAWSTGNAEWRYQLLGFLPLIGFLVLSIFFWRLRREYRGPAMKAQD